MKRKGAKFEPLPQILNKERCCAASKPRTSPDEARATHELGSSPCATFVITDH